MRKFFIPLTILFLSIIQISSFAQDQLTEKGGFSIDAGEEHHFLFVLNNRPADLPEVRAEITKYIWKYHPNDRLKITQIKIDGELENVPLIHINSFSDKASAMAFYQGLKSNRPVFLQMGMTVEYYPISKTNYEKVIRSKSLKGYKPFFQSNYR